MRGKRAGSIALIVTALPIQQVSADTVTYSYDALGRLVTTQVSGSTDSATTAYTYDAAGNRSAVVITGAQTTTALMKRTPGTPSVDLAKTDMGGVGENAR